MVDVAKRQIAATRNAGARASAGDMLVFVDADTRVNGALIAEVVAAMRSGAVGGGARVSFYEEVPGWVRFSMAIFTPFYFGIGRWAAGCFVFCTRAGFEAAGGFDETIYAGEEIGFSRALKRHGRFVIVRAWVETSPRKVRGRSAWQMLRISAGVIRKGGLTVGLKRREDAGFWYDERR